jgi:deoxyribonuclease V
MIACVDVHYHPAGSATAALLTFRDWPSEHAAAEHIAHLPQVEPYRPGELYKRELPCLLAVLTRSGADLDVLIVDAYVTLDPHGKPGLGARLHAALGGNVPVVGVAKTPFASASHAIPVLRGRSGSPLWVTSAGLDAPTAAAHVRSMHGPHRIPTLLREVDHLARTR